MMCTESGIESLYNLSHDNLTNAQRQFLYRCRRSGHMDMEKLKEFARQGFLPKDITNAKSPLCSSSIQAKQTRTSISKMASGRSVKAGKLRPGNKISCDHCQSREPGMTCNNHGKVLENECASCGTIFVDHVSDFTHHSI